MILITGIQALHCTAGSAGPRKDRFYEYEDTQPVIVQTPDQVIEIIVQRCGKKFDVSLNRPNSPRDPFIKVHYYESSGGTRTTQPNRREYDRLVEILRNELSGKALEEFEAKLPELEGSVISAHQRRQSALSGLDLRGFNDR